MSIPLKLYKVTMRFDNYSAEAIRQVIEDAPGKPYKDLDGTVIGIIKSAERVNHIPDTVQFTLEEGNRI